jgi:hypothetical protein
MSETGMLIRAFLALGIAAQPPSVTCTSPPQRLYLGAVSSRPHLYEGRLVEICGAVAPATDDQGAHVLYDTSPYSGEQDAIYLSGSPPPAVRGSTRLCMTGTVRRRDGLTTQEAEARGRTNRYVTDVALSNPDYAFYPLSCLQDAPARG